MLSTVTNAVKENKTEAWRWGIGGAFAVPIISWFLYQGAQDRTYMKDTFTETQSALAVSLDNLGDAIQADTAVSQMMATEFKSLAKETDDVGDEMRAQVKLMTRLLDTIEVYHAERVED